MSGIYDLLTYSLSLEDEMLLREIFMESDNQCSIPTQEIVSKFPHTSPDESNPRNKFVTGSSTISQSTGQRSDSTILIGTHENKSARLYPSSSGFVINNNNRYRPLAAPVLIQEDHDHNTNNSSERKRKRRWTIEEHRKFLEGLTKHRWGDWKSISEEYVTTKDTLQISHHAHTYKQYYHERRRHQDPCRMKQKSIHDTRLLDHNGKELPLPVPPRPPSHRTPRRSPYAKAGCAVAPVESLDYNGVFPPPVRNDHHVLGLQGTAIPHDGAVYVAPKVENLKHTISVPPQDPNDNHDIVQLQDRVSSHAGKDNADMVVQNLGQEGVVSEPFSAPLSPPRAGGDAAITHQSLEHGVHLQPLLTSLSPFLGLPDDCFILQSPKKYALPLHAGRDVASGFPTSSHPQLSPWIDSPTCTQDWIDLLDFN